MIVRLERSGGWHEREQEKREVLERPIAKTSAFWAAFKWAEVTGGMAVVR